MASQPTLSKDNGTCSSNIVDISDETRLIGASHINDMFPMATGVCFCVWICLVLLFYSLFPPEEYVYLEGAEREAAAAACYVFVVSTGLTAVPMLVRRTKKREVSGIIWAALAVQFIAMCTNAMLAWAPTVVVVDKITNSRVYLIRWAEWIPLSGLMTFFSEIVVCHEGLYGVLTSVLVCMAQSLSCLLAVVFPFCPSFMSWALCCFMSVSLYAGIFPRVFHKYKLYKTTKQGLTLDEMERSCRISFGFHLLATCSVVWSILVFFFFANAFAFNYYPDARFVKNQSLPMILDTLFDIIAKAFYMKIIVDVHEAVFDAEGRARRHI